MLEEKDKKELLDKLKIMDGQLDNLISFNFSIERKVKNVLFRALKRKEEHQKYILFCMFVVSLTLGSMLTIFILDVIYEINSDFFVVVYVIVIADVFVMFFYFKNKYLIDDPQIIIDNYFKELLVVEEVKDALPEKILPFDFDLVEDKEII